MKKPKYLFRGKHCFPISPKSKSGSTGDVNDQIVKILERFPNLEAKNDFSYTNQEDCTSYLNESLEKCEKKQSLESKLTGVNPALVEIVTDMLQINPYFRPSAYELL